MRVSLRTYLHPYALVRLGQVLRHGLWLCWRLSVAIGLNVAYWRAMMRLHDGRRRRLLVRRHVEASSDTEVRRADWRS